MIGSFRLPVSLTSGDTTLPTILSATVENANPNKLVVVFSEVVTITNTTGLTITGAATPTLSAPTGSGSNTITFTLSTALTNGQSVTLNVASSNTIKDTANNALAATTKAITNNVAASATYDVDYQAKLDFATANSIPVPSVAQSDIYNQTILDVKTTNAWLASSIAFDFSGDADIQFKLICLKRRVLAIDYGGGVWSNDGWLGNGTNSYIDPLFDTTSDTNWQLNSAGVFWKSFQKSTGTKVIIGNSGATTDYTLVVPNADPESYASINGTVNKLSPYGRLGLNMVSRPNSTEIKINGVNDSVSSGTKWEGALVIGARTTATKEALSLYTNEGIGFIAIGGDTSNDYTNLKTIFG